MVQNWEPGTQYNYGDVVFYEGHKYKIIQPHRSQGDWVPPVTPALWGRIPDEQYNDNKPPQYGGGGYNPGYNQQQPQQPQQPQQVPPPQPQPGYGGGYGQEKPQDQQSQASHDSGTKDSEEDKKKWYEDDKVKYGGLAAGAAALAGGLFYMHHKREEKKEEAIKQQSDFQSWVADGQRRTAEFYQSGPRGPITWLQVRQGENTPSHAIAGGEENGQPIYIARGFHNGSVQVGKFVPGIGGIIGYGHSEIKLPVAEVLVGDQRGVRWVNARGRLELEELNGARPVEGGYESDGTPLYIAQGHHNNSVQPGKISTKLKAAFVPYGNDEKELKDYRVLCYA